MTQMDSESIIGSSSSSTASSSLTINNVSSSQGPSLIQQYNWYYDKSELKRTPSILDNISYEKERMYRNEGARFILNAGSQMKLRYDTLATGVVYFHRFYMRHSFKVFPRYVTAACCLFLAGKAEETPKKCKDIIKIAKALLDDQHFATFGEDPKEEVLTLERIVLQTIRFDLQVEHPYKYLVSYAKCFKGNKDNIQAVLQMAWTFTNDSLCTTICLQWEPEIVAIAMIFLASKIRYEITDWEGRLPHQKHWWDIYVEDLNVELLEDICHQVLDLYSNSNEEPSRSPPPMSSSPQTPAIQTSGVRSAENASTTIKSAYPPPPPPGPPPTATNIQSIGQFRPVVGTILQSASNSVPNANTPQPGPPPNTTTIPPTLAPTLHGPPLPPHQWDPNMATFYNFPIVGIAGKTPSLTPVHIVPPPPPLPPGISSLGLAPMGANRLPPVVQPPIPPPPFVPPGVNQHQTT